MGAKKEYVCDVKFTGAKKEFMGAKKESMGANKKYYPLKCSLQILSNEIKSYHHAPAVLSRQEGGLDGFRHAADLIDLNAIVILHGCIR